MSPAQLSPGWEQPQTASQSTKYTICFHCASGCCLLGPSRSQDLSQGSLESRVQGGVEPVPLESGAGFSLPATARRPGFPPHPLNSLVLSFPLCKRNRLCVMILKDAYVLALFLRGLEH